VGTEPGPLPGALPPALLADGSPGYAAILGDARERAALIAGDLDQLDAADDGLTRVQRLVGRLRDAAVVGTDGTLQPVQRAALQRQVDLTLGDIDAAANGTRFDESLLRGGQTTVNPDGTLSSQPAPYRTIGTAKLGISGLAVRSADQAAAATEALDLATWRLQRQGRLIGAATNRLQGALQGLTNPSTTVDGTPALDGETAAFSAMVALRGQLLGSQAQAVQAQADLDVPRVRWLLDEPQR
jgi:flagellin-like hook-associated protein FlgL